MKQISKCLAIFQAFKRNKQNVVDMNRKASGGEAQKQKIESSIV